MLGGSQGAGALNAWIARHAASLIDGGLAVLHQLGPGRSAEAASAHAHYQAREFLQDVPAAIAAATLVLCRGGASTLAEVGALRKPAWVVPYPHHADRQQEHNAALLGGGVRLCLEDRLDGSLVPELVHAAGLEGAAQREAMAQELAERVPLDGLSRSLDELAALVS